MNSLPPVQNARHFARNLARRFCIVICIACSIQSATVLAQRTNQRPRSAVVTVSITPGHPANRFVPSHALGAGIDGHDKGLADLQLTSSNIQVMLSAGFKSLTYRLRTELAGDAWHWNPRGQWSDANNKRGYWVSESEPSAPISLSYGYRLPRRGNTIDQANDVGYSRLDDGDAESFWKSNPYLDREFTGENNSLHPQWIVIEFKRPELINAIRLLWGEPFAKRYQIQYGDFDDVSDIALSPAGTWRDFPGSAFAGSADVSSANGRNSDALIRLSQKPIRTRWLRILMTESSQTSSAATSDVRDRLGFAVREVSAGLVDAKERFHDRVRHGANRWKQTIVHVSSTDPWHRETDLDESVEQLGFDRTFHSGLSNDLPVLLPTGLAYDTPENAANEIRYLRERGHSFAKVELGEEPDGQYLTPEDFGALYLQWATAIHSVDPSLKLGGPSFQEILPDDEERAVKLGNSEWMRRFLGYLKRRGRLSDYSFFSFEWYPFDEVCEPVAPQLASAPKLLENVLHEMERRGLSRQIPWIISEYGYSAFATRAEISIEGALFNADIVGKFLTLGGDQAFLFGYTPGAVERDFPCTAGGNMLFLMDDDGDITHRFATYFGARLLTGEWLQPGNEVHEIYPASSDARNSKGEELVTAYAVHRPDGLWSVLMINKDPQRSFETNVIFRKTSSGSSGGFDGRLDVYQYSGQQYLLGGPAKNPYPVKADEPEHGMIEASRPRPMQISLPPYSLTVIRGRTSPLWVK
jgi:hypothetical protein